MIKGKICIGDVLYEPTENKIVEVVGWSEDPFGQHATVVKSSSKEIGLLYTSFFVFKYFHKLGSVLGKEQKGKMK